MKKNFLAITLLLMLALSGKTQPQPPKPPSTEEKLKHVSEKLNKEMTLTVSQKEKVNAAFKEFFTSMDKLRVGDKQPPPPPPPPPPGKKEDMDKLVKARDEQIRSVLSAAQYKKYQEIEKTLRPPRPGELRPPSGPQQ